MRKGGLWAIYITHANGALEKDGEGSSHAPYCSHILFLAQKKYRGSFLHVYSAPTETGMSRLALSDADKSARDWFVSTTEALGCKTTVDSMGNIFAVRPGLRNDKPPIFVGSHLDTQPTGGRYDGILGVTAGVEMLRVLGDNWVETEYPIGVVNWTKCVYSTY